jgi:hypothetical protein
MARPQVDVVDLNGRAGGAPQPTPKVPETPDHPGRAPSDSAHQAGATSGGPSPLTAYATGRPANRKNRISAPRSINVRVRAYLADPRGGDVPQIGDPTPAALQPVAFDHSQPLARRVDKPAAPTARCWDPPFRDSAAREVCRATSWPRLQKPPIRRGKPAHPRRADGRDRYGVRPGTSTSSIATGSRLVCTGRRAGNQVKKLLGPPGLAAVGRRRLLT